MLAPAGVAELLGDGIDEVAGEIVAALAPYQLADGSYRLSNEFRLLLATAYGRGGRGPAVPLPFAAADGHGGHRAQSIGTNHKGV